jgi:hypothetical protein
MEKYNEEKYKDKNISYIINDDELETYNKNNNTDIKETKFLIK